MLRRIHFSTLNKFLFVLAVALLFRLLGIASRPVWYDEAFSILFAEKGLRAMLIGTLAPTGAGTADIHPLGYYSLLWLWMKPFGETLVSVRLFSILASLGTVALIYHFARGLFNEKIAFAASLFTALAPFQVHYAQEIRMYAFLALWLLLATYAYWQGARTRNWRWWGLFTVSAALAQYTHNLAVFYLIPLALTLVLYKNWRALKAVMISGCVAALLYLPWLIHLPAQFAKVNQAYWIERPGPERLFTLLLTYVINLPLPDGWLLPGTFIALTAAAIAAWQTVRAVRQKREDAGLGLGLAYLSFTPPLLLFLVSQWRPVYLERALLPSGAIFCLWLAWALFATGLPLLIRNFIITLLLAGAAMGLYQHLTYNGFPYGPYAALDASLRERFQPGDVILHSSKLNFLPAVYYDRTLPQTYIGDPPGSKIDTLAPSTQMVLGLIAKPDIESAIGEVKRIRFIIFQQSINEYTEIGKNTHPHLLWLDEHYKLREVEDWGSLKVYIYEKP
jgi:uncharacterized membrane protein